MALLRWWRFAVGIIAILSCFPKANPQVETVAAESSAVTLTGEDRKLIAQIEELHELAGKLRKEVEKNETHVLSLRSLRMAEELERKAKRLKGKVKR
jgi:uncharacterized protein YlxW (UPF0749 family)